MTSSSVTLFKSPNSAGSTEKKDHDHVQVFSPQWGYISQILPLASGNYLLLNKSQVGIMDATNNVNLVYDSKHDKEERNLAGRCHSGFSYELPDNRVLLLCEYKYLTGIYDCNSGTIETYQQNNKEYFYDIVVSGAKIFSISDRFSNNPASNDPGAQKINIYSISNINSSQKPQAEMALNPSHSLTSLTVLGSGDIISSGTCSEISHYSWKDEMQFAAPVILQQPSGKSFSAKLKAFGKSNNCFIYTNSNDVSIWQQDSKTNEITKVFEKPHGHKCIIGEIIALGNLFVLVEYHQSPAALREVSVWDTALNSARFTASYIMQICATPDDRLAALHLPQSDNHCYMKVLDINSFYHARAAVVKETQIFFEGNANLTKIVVDYYTADLAEFMCDSLASNTKKDVEKKASLLSVQPIESTGSVRRRHGKRV